MAWRETPNGLGVDMSADAKINVYWMIPQPVNSLFVGRNELISEICHALRHENPELNQRKIYVLTGDGGQGKSEICLQVASLMQNE
jgi:Mrp family chromosome partitioning ATPase